MTYKTDDIFAVTHDCGTLTMIAN